MSGFGLGLAASAAAGLSTGFLPSDESGLFLWFDASENTTTDEDGVSSFVSRDANAWDIVQATGSKKPDLAVAYQNGLDAILFDGVDDDLRKAEAGNVLIDADDFTFFLAMKPSARHATANGSVYYIEGNHANGGWCTKYEIRPSNASGTDPDYFGAVGGAAVGTNKKDETDIPSPPGTLLDDNIVHLRANIDSTANDLAYIKNTQVYGSAQNATKSTIFSSGKIRLGDYNGGPYFNGYFYELLGYTEKKSVAACTTIFDYLSDKWAIYA